MVAATPLRILVVDDNRDSANSLSMLLELLGNTMHVVHDGAEALPAAEAFRPNVALLDIGLPTVSGYEIARSIRAQPWGAAVVLVAVTGWGHDEARRQSAEAGFDHHLTKPLDPKATVALLREEVSKRAAGLVPIL